MSEANPNDAIRNHILNYFYNRNAHATSRFGKKGSAIKISDAKRELKAKHGLTQQQVMSNLTYLIDRGWVKTNNQEKTVKVAGGTIPSVVTWYEIAALGIDKIEGESEFKLQDRFAGINIHASGSNVITLGDGNVVNVRFKELHEKLDELKLAVAESDDISDADKLDMAADIESLKDQLAKAQPSKSVVQALWSGIERASQIAGFIDLGASLSLMIRPLL